MNRTHKLAIIILISLIMIPAAYSISGRTVKGRINLNDTTTGAESATVVVKTNLTNFNCICTTGVGAHSYTDANGDYSILSNNLYFESACSGTGNSENDSCDGSQFNNDYLWIEVDGSTITPPQGNFTSSIGSSYTWASLYVSSEFADVINGTLALGPNTIPTLSYINISPSLIKGGLNVTITPSGQNDSNNDTLDLVCCVDTSNSCTPTTASNICTGSYYSNQSQPYTNLSCLYEASSSDNTYYARCLLHDGRDYSTTVRSDTFQADGTPPATSDNYAYDGSWINQNASITITENCNVAGCNTTFYCTDASNTCTPTTNITGGAAINISSEGTTYLRYFSQDTVGNTQSIQSANVSLDFTIPAIADDYANDNSWVNTSQNITLSPSDALSGISSVKYCTGVGCNASAGTTLNSPYLLEFTTQQNNITLRYVAIDNASNPSPIGSFVLKIDFTAPTTSDNFTKNDIWINYDAPILITPNCDVSGCSFTKYCTDTTNTCTPSISIASPTTVTISSENITYLRYHSKDNAGNTQDVQFKKVKIDKTDTSAANAFAVIDNNVTYSTDATLSVNWSGFEDTLSGINSYYINFSNNAGTSNGLNFAEPPAAIGGASEGTVTVYVWPVDNASNIGAAAVSDDIIVDLTNPTGVSIFNVTENSGADYLYYNASSITLYYSNIGNSGFSILVDAADAISGLANATGETAFSDSPIDATEAGGSFEYNLTYTIEVPSAYSEALTLTVSDLSGRTTTTDLTVARDVTSPSVSLTDNFNGWNSDSTPTFTWTVSDSQSGLQKFFWNINNAANQTITDTSNNSVTVSPQSDGNHTFYLYTYDNVGNIDESTHDFGIDSSAPSTPSQMIDEGVYDIDGNYTITWPDITDTSGVTYLLYESVDGGAYSLIASPSTNSSYLSGKLNSKNYTYKVTAVNGAGLYSSNSSPSDGVLVDLESPSFSGFQNDPIESNTTTAMTVNVTVTEDESGLNATPIIRYKYGSEAFSSWVDLTLVSGSEYTYEIPVPGGGWVNFTGENVTWEFYAADFAGNTNTSQQTDVITSVNSITFNVRDRVLQTSLKDLTITGGSSCSSGCAFNSSITIFENNGLQSFTISKSGFSSNSTSVNVSSQNYVINVSLDDTESPVITFINFTPVVTSVSRYNITVYANITENFNLSSAILNYALSGGASQTGVVNFTLVENDTYRTSIGTFNDSVFMESNITAVDLYNNSVVTELNGVWFVLVGGLVNTTYPPVLDPIGTQVLTVDEPFSLTATASDLNNDPLTFADNASFFNINSTSGLISFTPNESLTGTHVVNISVSDGLLIDYELVHFRIGSNILELEQGWNLISTPDVVNESIQDIFSELSNGNFGCGRGGDPLVCDESDGDFVGNFSKIIGYNATNSSFITFNPTDYYLSIPNQTLQDIDPSKGYWINVTGEQNVTLIIT